MDLKKKVTGSAYFKLLNCFLQLEGIVFGHGVKHLSVGDEYSNAEYLCIQKNEKKATITET